MYMEILSKSENRMYLCNYSDCVKTLVVMTVEYDSRSPFEGAE